MVDIRNILVQFKLESKKVKKKLVLFANSCLFNGFYASYGNVWIEWMNLYKKNLTRYNF